MKSTPVSPISTASTQERIQEKGVGTVQYWEIFTQKEEIVGTFRFCMLSTSEPYKVADITETRRSCELKISLLIWV